MTKNELIEQLNKITGNPKIYIQGQGLHEGVKVTNLELITLYKYYTGYYTGYNDLEGVMEDGENLDDILIRKVRND